MKIRIREKKGVLEQDGERDTIYSSTLRSTLKDDNLFTFTDFDPTIENWFWIEIFSQAFRK